MKKGEANTLLKAKGKSFYWASKLLNKKHAENAAELYSVCRQVDDLVDEASSRTEARLKLSQFRDETLKSDFFAQAGIDREAFIELTRGVESDLGLVRIEDEKELLHYCYQVAGTVGIMMCNVLGVKDPAAFPHAVDLGIAMQLTNICRDVADDSRLGRRYLPATLVGSAAVEDLTLPLSDQRQQITTAITHLLELADFYYQSGRKGLIYLPFQARLGILIASELYRKIGVKLKARDCNYWTERVCLNFFEKMGVTLHLFFRILTSTQYFVLPSSGRTKRARLWK